MAESIKNLVYVIILALPAFHVSRKIAVPTISAAEFKLWRNSWFLGTAAAFLSGNFFAFIIALGLICCYARRRTSRLALFVILLFTAPAFKVTVDGFGIVNQLMQLDHAQALAVLLLVPALFRPHGVTEGSRDRYVTEASLSASASKTRSGIGRSCDFIIVIYVALQAILAYRDASATNVLRVAFVSTLSIAIPYFAFSRRVRSIVEIRVILVAFIVAILPLASIGAFETVKDWLLYPSIATNWGVPLNTPYVVRDGMLRAYATAGQPIAYGYTIMTAVGCLLAIRIRVAQGWNIWLAFGMLAVGLVASFSRGPWVGTALLFIVMVLTGPNKLKSLSRLLGCLICLLPLLFTPLGDRALRLLPFVGSVEVETLDYRDQLIDSAFEVIAENPFTGVADYTVEPKMLKMVQGQGIIDVTNTYLQIGLTSGLIGLGLFLGFFSMIVIHLVRSLKNVPPSELNMSALLATLLAILFTIATVSSIFFIPYIYWILAGLSIGLMRSTGKVETRQYRLQGQVALSTAMYGR